MSRDYPGWIDHVQAELVVAGRDPKDAEWISDLYDKFGFNDLDDTIEFVTFYGLSKP